MTENIYLLYSQTKTKNLDNKLFNRNLKNEEVAKQTEKDNIQKQYDLFQNAVIPEIKDYLNEKEKRIQNTI